MNGESAFGWLKAALALLALALLSFVAFKAWQYFKSKGIFGAAQDLKENTVIGAPSRAIDSIISFFTGREETLGGELAEIFDPATRKANAMNNSTAPKTSKPAGDPSVLMGGTNDIYLGDLPIGEIALPNPRDAR